LFGSSGPRIALIGALCAGLALAACGRKGPLEPPPSASISQPQQVEAQPSLGDPQHTGLEGERTAAEPAPRPTSAQRKTTPLDWLLQ
jgi:predicted small lipoprotein YifL